MPLPLAKLNKLKKEIAIRKKASKLKKKNGTKKSNLHKKRISNYLHKIS